MRVRALVFLLFLLAPILWGVDTAYTLAPTPLLAADFSSSPGMNAGRPRLSLYLVAISSNLADPFPYSADGVASPGEEELALVFTLPRAYVTLLITYPHAKPVVIGPRRATVNGYFAYAWTLPYSVRELVRVTAVTSNGVAERTLTIK